MRLNREEGQTFVLVTHSDQVGGRAHRIVRMSDGVIITDELNGSHGESRGDGFSASDGGSGASNDVSGSGDSNASAESSGSDD